MPSLCGTFFRRLFIYIKPEDASRVVEAIRRKAGVERPLSHDELVEELHDLYSKLKPHEELLKDLAKR
jgi:predicted HAD superfamily phosphohydrolase